MNKRKKYKKQDTLWIWLLAAVAILFIAFVALMLSASLRHNGALGSLRLPKAQLAQRKFHPPILKSLIVNPRSKNNYFNFILDTGERALSDQTQLEPEVRDLIKHFFLGVTLPSEDFWVNLNFGQQDRITSPRLGLTDAGKILLEADLKLKKDVAYLTDPRHATGAEYWRILNEEIQKLRLVNPRIPQANRVWIVPDRIVVEEEGDTFTITRARLKVCLESDYLAKYENNYICQDEEEKKLIDCARKAMEEAVLPSLERQVNYGVAYAPLRQVYHSLILAECYKRRYWGGRGFFPHTVNQCYLEGLHSKTPWSKKAYFDAYVHSVSQGEYSFQRSEFDPHQFDMIKKRYISGGIKLLIAGDLNVESSPQESLSSPSISNNRPLLQVDVSNECNPNDIWKSTIKLAKLTQPEGVTSVVSSPAGLERDNFRGVVDSYIKKAVYFPQVYTLMEGVMEEIDNWSDEKIAEEACDAICSFRYHCFDAHPIEKKAAFDKLIAEKRSQLIGTTYNYRSDQIFTEVIYAMQTWINCFKEAPALFAKGRISREELYLYEKYAREYFIDAYLLRKYLDIDLTEMASASSPSRNYKEEFKEVIDRHINTVKEYYHKVYALIKETIEEIDDWHGDRIKDVADKEVLGDVFNSKKLYQQLKDENHLTIYSTLKEFLEIKGLQDIGTDHDYCPKQLFSDITSSVNFYFSPMGLQQPLAGNELCKEDARECFRQAYLLRKALDVIENEAKSSPALQDKNIKAKVEQAKINFKREIDTLVKSVQTNTKVYPFLEEIAEEIDRIYAVNREKILPMAVEKVLNPFNDNYRDREKRGLIIYDGWREFLSLYKLQKVAHDYGPIQLIEMKKANAKVAIRALKTSLEEGWGEDGAKRAIALAQSTFEKAYLLRKVLDIIENEAISSPARRPIILLIEDTFDEQKTYKRELEDRGYEVIIKPNGEEALGYLIETRNSHGRLPNVVLSDWRLGHRKMRGPKVLCAIREKGFGMPLFIHTKDDEVNSRVRLPDGSSVIVYDKGSRDEWVYKEIDKIVKRNAEGSISSPARENEEVFGKMKETLGEFEQKFHLKRFGTAFGDMADHDDRMRIYLSKTKEFFEEVNLDWRNHKELLINSAILFGNMTHCTGEIIEEISWNIINYKGLEGVIVFSDGSISKDGSLFWVKLVHSALSEAFDYYAGEHIPTIHLTRHLMPIFNQLISTDSAYAGRLLNEIPRIRALYHNEEWVAEFIDWYLNYSDIPIEEIGKVCAELEPIRGVDILRLAPPCYEAAYLKAEGDKKSPLLKAIYKASPERADNLIVELNNFIVSPQKMESCKKEQNVVKNLLENISQSGGGKVDKREKKDTEEPKSSPAAAQDTDVAGIDLRRMEIKAK